MPNAAAIRKTAKVCIEMSTGPSKTLVLADKVSTSVPTIASKSCVARRAAPFSGKARETSGVVAIAMVFLIADCRRSRPCVFLYWLPCYAAIGFAISQQLDDIGHGA